MPVLASIAASVWLASQVELIDYTIKSSSLGFAYPLGLLAGLLICSVLPPSRSENSHRLFNAGACALSTIPLTRISAIHFGSTGFLVVVAALVVIGFRSVVSKEIQSLWIAVCIFGLSVIIGTLSGRNISFTTIGATIGLLSMASGLAIEGRESPKHAIVGLLVAIALSVVFFESIPTVVQDAGNNRFSLITIANPKRGASHLLLINGRSHFVSTEEQRYHACITQLPVQWALKNGKTPKRALVLFGGDGLIARNLLAVKSIKEVTLVEPDGALVQLAKNNVILRSYNLDSLTNQRTKLTYETPFRFVLKNRAQFDLVIADLPVASGSTRKYYTTEFLQALFQSLSKDGIAAVAFPMKTMPPLVTQSKFEDFLFQDPSGQRQFVIHTALKPANRSDYLGQHCISKRKSPSAEPLHLKNIVAGIRGGEGRASMVHIQSVTRLSLPR